MDRLDKEFPQGNPDAIVCRWCSNVRVIVRQGVDESTIRACKRCDAPDHTIATWQQ